MKGITICPNCGQPTLKVKEEAVKNQAIESKYVSSKKAKWQVCVNENRQRNDLLLLQNNKRRNKRSNFQGF